MMKVSKITIDRKKLFFGDEQIEGIPVEDYELIDGPGEEKRLKLTLYVPHVTVIGTGY